MITIKTIYDRRKRATRQTPGAVEIRITIDRRTIYINTGVRVLKSEWVAGSVCNRADAAQLNKRLQLIASKVEEDVNTMIEKGYQVDGSTLRDRVWRIMEDESDTALMDWIAEQVPLLNIKDGTRKHYTSLMVRLAEYGKLVRWYDVTVEGIVNFDAWLHSLRPVANDAGAKAYGRLGVGLSDGAIYNYHKCLKALLRRAKMFGRIDTNPYELLRGQFKRGDRESVEYLTEDEMSAVRELRLPADSPLAIARDLFVLQMFTGLSYSDAEQFDIHQYRKVDGRWINNGERVKTGVPYISQLLPPVVDVLERYGWRVPQMENHVYNRYLKDIGLMAGITTRLHSHLARHSFATMMLANGSKIENVSRMLGHTNIMHTQRYAKVLAENVHADFDRMEDKLSKK